NTGHHHMQIRQRLPGPLSVQTIQATETADVIRIGRGDFGGQGIGHHGNMENGSSPHFSVMSAPPTGADGAAGLLAATIGRRPARTSAPSPDASSTMTAVFFLIAHRP